MYQDSFMASLSSLSSMVTRSISAENPTGEPGRGGMATEGLGKNSARDLGQGWKVSPAIQIAPGEVATLGEISGSGSIRHIWMTNTCPVNRRLILRMYWDGSETPSVEAPVGDFFACADEQDFAPLSSLPVCVNPRRALNCYWDMPFRKGARITVENTHSEPVVLFYQIDYVLCDVPADCGYFHAQFRRQNPLPYAEPYTILDGVRGKGRYVGTYLFWGVNHNGWWGEGEIKFFMDGDGEYPTICGTGTEDYFCGAWNFDVNGKYQDFCTPYTGMRVFRPDGLYRANQRFSLYRWHLSDPICFEKDLRVTIQALGWRSEGRYLPLQDDISSVAFWYQDSVDDTFPPLPDRDHLEIT